MSGFKRLGRELLKSALAGAAGYGAYALLRRLRGPRIFVLGYHRVVDEVPEDGPVNPALCVSTATFRRQMERVRRDFTVLPLDAAMRAIDGELWLDRDACAITFDDGYQDVFERAHPILAELGIPATVFVPSGYVGETRALTHDRLYAAYWRLRRDPCGPPPGDAVDSLIATLPAGELEQIAVALERRVGVFESDAGGRVMGPEALRALATAGWEIGAHTIGHVVLTHEPQARAFQELERSRLDLERFTGAPCRFFAYCNGLHSPPLVELVRRAGYTGAVTTCDRPNSPGGDRFRVGRKVLWEGHVRGLDGRFSEPRSTAHLHDLFGALGLTRPLDGEVATPLEEVTACA